MRFSRILAAASLLTVAFAHRLPAGQQAAPKAHTIAVQVHGTSSYLGVYCMDIDGEIARMTGLREERGVLITKVDAESPALRAGLMEKDVIQEYNGQRVEGTAHFSRLVSETPAGRKVNLGVFRNGQTVNLTAQIGARTPQSLSWSATPSAPMAPRPPEPPSMDLVMPDIPSGLLGWQSSSLGYMSEPIDGQLADFFGVKEGVLVRSVVPKSAAEKAGLKAGDVIVKADGMAVRSPSEISGMLRRQREKRRVSLTVVRAHKEMILELIAKNKAPSDSRVLCRRSGSSSCSSSTL
jgi:serine protease Do